MVKLYEITEQVFDMFKSDLSGDEIKEHEKQLQQMLSTKAPSLVSFARQLESDIEALRSEELRLHGIRTKKESTLERYKQYVKNNLEAMGVKRVDTEIGTISIAKSPSRVHVIDDFKVPDDFLVFTNTCRPDKIAILEHFKETGEVIDGVEIIDTDTSLRIK